MGESTDSYDITGKVVNNSNFVPSLADEACYGSFIGKQIQVPPIFSALKVNGRRAYDYARKEKKLSCKVEIEVFDFQLLKYNHLEAEFKLHCKSLCSFNCA